MGVVDDVIGTAFCSVSIVFDVAVSSTFAASGLFWVWVGVVRGLDAPVTGFGSCFVSGITSFTTYISSKEYTWHLVYIVL